MMKALDRAFRVTESLKLAERSLAPRPARPSRWKPVFIGAGVGTGAFLILWFFFRGRGTGGGSGGPGKVYKVDRALFSVNKLGVSYKDAEGKVYPMTDSQMAVATARRIDPAVVEIHAAGDAILGIVRELRDALVAAGFHVVGNQAVLEA